MANFYLKFNKLACLQSTSNYTLEDYTSNLYNLKSSQYYIVHNGTIVSKNSHPTQNGLYQVFLRLCGGKGGFGNMLRAVGLKMTQSTNQEACRNLEGRRLKDIENQKRYKKYEENQKELKNEREAKKAEKRRKMDEAKLPAKLDDEQYFKKRERIYEGLKSAFEDGMKFKKVVHKNKRRKINDDLLPFLSDESMEEESAEEEIYEEDFEDFSDDLNDYVKEEEKVEEVGEKIEQVEKKVEEEKKEVVVEECQKKRKKKYVVVMEDVEVKIDLEKYGSVGDLEELGLECLKMELIARGMKCGGTLKQRAERLWCAREGGAIDPKLLAKK